VVILANAAMIGLGLMMFFGETRKYQPLEPVLWLLALVALFGLNIFFIAGGKDKDFWSDSFIGLYWKRKALEERKKIAELESSDLPKA
jgi:hypothetical protein